MAIGDRLARLFTGLHTAVYRRSRGKVAGAMGKTPLLLLTTQGRKSGQPRTTPLAYTQDGANYVVIASAGGADKHPAWYFNLRDNPQAHIEVRERRLPVRAETATGAERARLWAQMVAQSPQFAGYERKTSREIPVVILRPARG